MKPTLCTRCKKNVAVIFITKIENGASTNEGLCLKCAKDLGIKQVDDIVRQMGMSDEDLENMTNEMTSMMGLQPGEEDDDEDVASQTATFPFLNKLFGNADAPLPSVPKEQEKTAPKDSRKKKKKFLDAYCLNLTEKAREGSLDHIVGREVETERVIQILNRRQKNNPCLIGEPGVGKTAIAEGLAQRIAAGDVPFKLRDKEVYLLDMTALVAGTQFRGQFESRMKSLIGEIKAFGNIILVIDEVHNLVGAGDAEGSMNAANILKPALSRGEVQVIGATTFTEYRKYIEKDAALERRFQPVTVAEPTLEEAIAIVRGIAHYYEQFHGVRIPPEIARQTVLLSERYITERFLPDKAIDLLDEACSDVNLRSREISRLAELKKERDDLDLEIRMLTEDAKQENFERLANLRSKLCVVNEEIETLSQTPPPMLTLENLARIIEMWTKIPASKIQAQEYTQLQELGDRLRKRVVGQDEAIDAVCNAIRRSRVGISPKKRPVSFIFVGSTGVGKTELVKCLAEDLFDSVDSLVRLDMSEYMEKHSVSKLIGSPPGYVGYDEAGQLTETVRRRPYCVILFDEIEKAHPDVMNILLQILDDGHITDAHGRKVNFANAVLIMTSNAGSDEKSAGSMGFDRSSNEQAKDKAMKALKAFLRPEFLNRLDDVICFEHLSEESMAKIAHILLKELKASMAEKGIGLTWSDAAAQQLAKMSYSETYGARNLRRCIENEVEDRIVDLIMEQQGAVTRISVGCRNGKLTVQAK
jgi:ATPases with chaperone activity, ATP-binding subunit